MMKGATVVDAKGQQLLELLSEGASTAVLAKKLGYSPGTVRVYLHNLYRAIGVRNRTEAVLWHLNRVRPAQGMPVPQRSRVSLADETFGDVAAREGLLAALGVMESFIGPYGRVWEVGLRLKGEALDERTLALRDDSRLLWRALLQANFGYGKALYDEGAADSMLGDSPSDGLLLATLLLLGGYSHVADGCIAKLNRARKTGRTLSARETNFLRALKGAAYEADLEAIGVLTQLAADKSTPTVLKHVAVVALFQVYRFQRDAARAADTANVLWAQAEGARQQLEAMGVRPLAREAAIPKPGRPATRVAPAREKVAAGS
jgi:DNA-binding CsgD family transcriptional regulator